MDFARLIDLTSTPDDGSVSPECTVKTTSKVRLVKTGRNSTTVQLTKLMHTRSHNTTRTHECATNQNLGTHAYADT